MLFPVVAISGNLYVQFAYYSKAGYLETRHPKSLRLWSKSENNWRKHAHTLSPLPISIYHGGIVASRQLK